MTSDACQVHHIHDLQILDVLGLAGMMTMHSSGQDEKMLSQADLAYAQHADDLTIWLSRRSKIPHIQKRFYAERSK